MGGRGPAPHPVRTGRKTCRGPPTPRNGHIETALKISFSFPTGFRQPTCDAYERHGRWGFAKPKQGKPIQEAPLYIGGFLVSETGCLPEVILILDFLKESFSSTPFPYFPYGVSPLYREVLDGYEDDGFR